MAAEKLCFKDYLECKDDKKLSKTRKRVNAKSHKKRVYGLDHSYTMSGGMPVPAGGDAGGVSESRMHNAMIPGVMTAHTLGVTQSNTRPTEDDMNDENQKRARQQQKSLMQWLTDRVRAEDEEEFDVQVRSSGRAGDGFDTSDTENFVYVQKIGGGKMYRYKRGSAAHERVRRNIAKGAPYEFVNPGSEEEEDILMTGSNIGSSKDKFAVVDTKAGGWKRAFPDEETAMRWANAWNSEYGHKERVKVIPIRGEEEEGSDDWIEHDDFDLTDDNDIFRTSYNDFPPEDDEYTVDDYEDFEDPRDEEQSILRQAISSYEEEEDDYDDEEMDDEDDYQHPDDEFEDGDQDVDIDNEILDLDDAADRMVDTVADDVIDDIDDATGTLSKWWRENVVRTSPSYSDDTYDVDDEFATDSVEDMEDEQSFNPDDEMDDEELSYEEEEESKIDQAREMMKQTQFRPDFSRGEAINELMRRLNITNSTAVSYYERIAKELGLTGRNRDKEQAAGGAVAAPAPTAPVEAPMEDPIEKMDGVEMDEPNRQGIIRRVDNAHLVYKRQNEEGSYDELWAYNVGDSLESAMKIRKDILAGTDIPKGKTKSDDGQQKYTLTTMGNAQILHITGLPN